jgi:hypothetical protein
MFTEEEFKNVSLTNAAKMPSFKMIVVQDWSATKAVLELIYAGIKNPIAKMVVRLSIVIGDGLYNKFTQEQSQ